MSQNIFIKNIDGPTFSFLVDVKIEKVKDLMEKYGKKCGLKPEELQLVYSGKLLADKSDMLLH